MTSGQKRRKEEMEKKKERGGVRRERCAERRKGEGKARSPSGCPPSAGLCLFHPVGSSGEQGGFWPTSSGSLVSSSTSIQSSGFFVPSLLPFPGFVFLPGSFSYLLGPHVLTLFSALVSPWASPPPEPPQACAGLSVLSVPITPPVTLCGHCVVLRPPPPGSCCRGSHGLFIAVPQNAAGNLALSRCSINIRGMNE